jgi:hypothetical protein
LNFWQEISRGAEKFLWESQNKIKIIKFFAKKRKNLKSAEYATVVNKESLAVLKEEPQTVKHWSKKEKQEFAGKELERWSSNRYLSQSLKIWLIWTYQRINSIIIHLSRILSQRIFLIAL